MTDQEIIYKAISEVVNTDNPSEFAAHNSTCYTIAKYVCEELREELNSLPAEQPSEDLEEAAMKEAHKRYRDCPPLNIGGDYEFAEYHGEERELFVEGAQWGAQWQKEQLMKSAIDTIVASRWKDHQVCLITEKDIPQIYERDRIKIIIVKENKQ